MNIKQLQDKLIELINLTESPAKPMRGPYQSLPRITIVSNQSVGYQGLSSDLMMSATRPLMGEDISGKNEQCYYPVGLVKVDLNKPDFMSENLSLDASFIAAIDDTDYQVLCESLIDSRHKPLYNALGDDKKRSVLESIAKGNLKMITLENALEASKKVASNHIASESSEQQINKENEGVFAPSP